MGERQCVGDSTHRRAASQVFQGRETAPPFSRLPMEVGGWKREDFESDEAFYEWATSRPSKVDYDMRVANIIANGLPARLLAKWDGRFMCIECEPLDGWIWLATGESIAREMQGGWRPHISLSKWTGDTETFQRVVERYHEREVVLKISSVSSGATAMLAWEGVGADPDLWALYTGGEFAYKWHVNHFGLHVSL